MFLCVSTVCLFLSVAVSLAIPRLDDEDPEVRALASQAGSQRQGCTPPNRWLKSESSGGDPKIGKQII